MGWCRAALLLYVGCSVRSGSLLPPVRRLSSGQSEGFRPGRVAVLTKTTRYEFEQQRHRCAACVRRSSRRWNEGIEVQVVKRRDYDETTVRWADAIISAGGDGTMLLAANKVRDRFKPVIGVNTDPERHKISRAALLVSSSPWTQSTACPTHPNFTPSRLVPLGSEGNSLCRQERSQTAKIDPPSGIPGAGLRHGRDPASRKSRGPTRSAGVGKGTLRLLLPGSFAPPSAQHQMGLQILQSVQNLHFQPPMPRPPADREP